MVQELVRIGVIGTGGMGGRHARNLALRTAGTQIVALMDIDTDRAAALADVCGGARVYTDAQQLIDDPDVEAVVIASPDRTHAALALACIAANKPVLCEKPLATSLADAQKVVTAEVEAGRRLLQLGFMREYDPAHQEVKETIVSGRIGRPLLFRGLHSNVGSGPPRTIADVIINSAIHDIHSARWFMDDEVNQVYAKHIPADPSQPETCRMAFLQLTFTKGGLATIEMNADAGYGYEVSVEIVGEKASVGSTGLSITKLRHQYALSQTIDPDWLKRFDMAYIAEVQAWVEAARQRVATGPSAWDGYISLAIADAAIQSARSGMPQAVTAMARPELYARA